MLIGVTETILKNVDKAALMQQMRGRQLAVISAWAISPDAHLTSTT